ncbi:hypothetical protein D3C78_1428730 [compost metagenome]
MQINQCAECALRATEQPVNRALLVALHMVSVELAQEVIAQAVVTLALDVEGLFDKRQVVLVMRIAKSHTQELAETQGDVVREPVTVEQRDHVVVIGREAGLWHFAQIVLQRLALVGQNQPRLVEAIAAKHAAHGIGHQLAHGVSQQHRLQFFLAPIATIAIVRVRGERDLTQWHLGR